MRSWPAGARPVRPKGEEDKDDGGVAEPDRSRAGGRDALAPVVVDVENLGERVVPVPVRAARYAALRATAGGLVWLDQPLAGVLGESLARPGAEGPKARLVRYDFEKRRQLTLVDSAEWVFVSGDGKSLVVKDGGSLFVVPSGARVEASSGPDAPSDRVDVDTSRIRVQVDPDLEWRQMYDEAARLIARPLLDRGHGRRRMGRGRRAGTAPSSSASPPATTCRSSSGRSRASSGPPMRTRPLRPARWRGCDARGSSAPTSPAATTAAGVSSGCSRESPRCRPPARPLLAPGASVAVGEILVAVDGVPVDPVRGPGPTLVGAADQPVALTVERPDGERREVVVTPLADERPLRYQAWVTDRRAAVHAATAGRAGYLHVPDMMGAGWAQLHRDLRVEVARDSLIVDLRDNAGGHVSQLVLEKLARTVLGWDVARHHNEESYPADAPRGPFVAIVNEQAGSDGDIVTAAIKLRGLAPVVGTRTWGGVIGIDSRYRLVDGTLVTQPRYAFWFDGLGWGVENHGVDPDIEVSIPPQAWARGEDPQLEVALQTLGELSERRPPATPPDGSTRPSRRPPPLPPRPSS